ncbi:hypothetical protein FKM82_018380, partial [Ascaphus truei]
GETNTVQRPSNVLEMMKEWKNNLDTDEGDNVFEDPTDLSVTHTNNLHMTQERASPISSNGISELGLDTETDSSSKPSTPTKQPPAGGKGSPLSNLRRTQDNQDHSVAPITHTFKQASAAGKCETGKPLVPTSHGLGHKFTHRQSATSRTKKTI